MNGLDYVHLWVKFSVQNIVLRETRRKKSEMFLCGVHFSFVSDEMFISPNSTPPIPPTPCPKKFLVARLTHSLFFLQNAPS